VPKPNIKNLKMLIDYACVEIYIDINLLWSVTSNSTTSMHMYT